jgi:hypothetical protein
MELNELCMHVHGHELMLPHGARYCVLEHWSRKQMTYGWFFFVFFLMCERTITMARGPHEMN